MTAELLAGYAGIILSLAFAYIPGVKEWYDALATQHKAAVMAGLLVVVAVGVFGITCGNLYDFGIVCGKTGAVDLLKILIAALIANQGAYTLFVKPYKA